MKDLVRTADLSPADLTLILDRAAEIANDPSVVRGLLRGDSVVLHFEKPSTRTRLSFETAVARLGGHSIFVRGDELQLSRGETIEDTARVAGRYARAWIMRSARHENVERFASAASIHVVNALTDLHHPCQSLADLLTIRRREGRLRGVEVAWVGPGNNVAHSFIEAAMLAGMHVHVACPRGHGPNEAVVARATRIAEHTGGLLRFFEDAASAVRGVKVVYTDVWSSMTDAPEGASARRAALEPFRVDAPLFGGAADGAFFLHCLPCHRGDEVTAEVIDGPRSAVWDQAENRLHTATALLDLLVRRELTGAP